MVESTNIWRERGETTDERRPTMIKDWTCRTPSQPNDNEDVSTIGPTSMGDDDQSTLYNSSRSLPRIFDAGAELESMFRAEMAGDNKHRRRFPPSCLPIVRLLAGNQCCVDCGYDQSNSLNYASIGYGTILCHHCAHRHMTLSKEVSVYRSLLTFQYISSSKFATHNPSFISPSSLITSIRILMSNT